MLTFRKRSIIGCMGKSAEKLLPALNNSIWRPTELWDKNGDGITVKKPDFASLTCEDAVLPLPTKKSVLDEFASEVEGCRAKVYDHADIQEILTQSLFIQLENARLR